MQPKYIDLLVIGGGIQGVGVASDAAGRGLSVVLCEKDDLANHTSSASSKLIHGGLRYLEQGEFSLVRSALHERETLLRLAPHLVHPLEFVLPQDKSIRSAWVIRFGLLLYDYLSSRKGLKRSEKINFRSDPRQGPLKDNFQRGFSYMDCFTDDARLVIANAQQARYFGATILTRTEVQPIKTTPAGWSITAFDKCRRREVNFIARAIVNASGAWASEIQAKAFKKKPIHAITWVKGSHIVVPKLYVGSHAYILQNKDRRIVFVIPYKQDYTLIGTTDVVYTGDPNGVEISNEEIDYLLQSVHSYFKITLTRDHLLWHYSGIRSLLGDPNEEAAKMTREYALELHESSDHAPMVSILGGKLTTYRCVVDRVMQALSNYFPNLPNSQTSALVLPGGDLLGLGFEKFCETLTDRYPFLPSRLLRRYAENYGSLTLKLLSKVVDLKDLGSELAPQLYEIEVRYLLKEEWAMTAEDVLFRRTKCGIEATPEQRRQLDAFMLENQAVA